MVQRQGFRHLRHFLRPTVERGGDQRNLAVRQRLYIFLRHGNHPAAVSGGFGAVGVAVQHHLHLMSAVDIAAPAGNQQLAAALDGAQHVIAGDFIHRQRRYLIAAVGQRKLRADVMIHARAVGMIGGDRHFAAGNGGDIAFRHGDGPHTVVTQRTAVGFSMQGDQHGVAWRSLIRVAGNDRSVAVLIIRDGVVD